MFHYTVTSDKTIEMLVQSLETNLKEEKFGILWEFDVKDTLDNKGFDFNQPYLILEVCNPKEAYDMLHENQMVGYFLPCKLVVYKDGDQTKVGMPRPTELIQLVNDPSLNGKAKEIEERLIGVLDKSK
ncbi:DUF302 domain-containing protein [Paraliobacillus sp. JSM ZJ581]|uniref:DUF302 domain-containing protein n=1 Tax=Paraliobacillus sp. JSM ZJ581 TaxID=3342118 RepID=UPI0035A8995E